jgi:hypothetical protein
MVSFKFSPTATDADKQAWIASLNAIATIPNVVRVVHGTNVAGRSKAEFHYGLLVEFTSEEAEHAYCDLC